MQCYAQHGILNLMFCHPVNAGNGQIWGEYPGLHLDSNSRLDATEVKRQAYVADPIPWPWICPDCGKLLWRFGGGMRGKCIEPLRRS